MSFVILPHVIAVRSYSFESCIRKIQNIRGLTVALNLDYFLGDQYNYFNADVKPCQAAGITQWCR